MKIEVSRQIFEKYSNVKFHENPSSGSRVVPRGEKSGRTDKNDKANVPFIAILRTRLKYSKSKRSMTHCTEFFYSVYIYIYTHTHTHTHIYIYIYIRMHKYMCVYIYTHTH
jgi:hypothetical protein